MSKTSNRMKRRRKGLIIKQNYSCADCGCHLSKDYPGTLDHIHPKSKGGTNHKENLQVLCLECNLLKADNVLIRPTKEMCTKDLTKTHVEHTWRNNY